MRNRIFLTSILLWFGSVSSIQASLLVTQVAAKPDTLPVPKNVKNLLFYLQRNPNTNTVVYELNKTNQGTLNEADPIRVYWIRYMEKGVRKELSYLQRKYAYGLKTKKLGKDNFEIQFVSYSKLLLYLRKDPANNQYQVYTTINHQPGILDRVFVRIEGGTFWVPNVLYVELSGRDAKTGQAITGRFKP